jgi:hypothetical protein
MINPNRDISIVNTIQINAEDTQRKLLSRLGGTVYLCNILTKGIYICTAKRTQPTDLPSPSTLSVPPEQNILPPNPPSAHPTHAERQSPFPTTLCISRFNSTNAPSTIPLRPRYQSEDQTRYRKPSPPIVIAPKDTDSQQPTFAPQPANANLTRYSADTT